MTTSLRDPSLNAEIKIAVGDGIPESLRGLQRQLDEAREAAAASQSGSRRTIGASIVYSGYVYIPMGIYI